MRDVGLTVLRSAEDSEIRSERDRQLLGVETFSKLLELVTIRHRLLEATVESEHLAQLRQHNHSNITYIFFTTVVSLK